mgnify:CR=1 FL=1
MNISDAVLQSNEKIVLSLRELYSKYGYVPYRMSKFEEYDLYAKNKDFLVSDNVITFTDTSGKLMALKPDVTLSIIKNSPDDRSDLRKVFYNENVYRVSKGTNSFKEIMQSGIECIGDIKDDDICSVLNMAAEALSTLSDSYILSLSNLDILNSLISKLDLSSGQIKKIYKAIEEKNIPEISTLCNGSREAEKIKKLLSVYGKAADVLTELDSILADEDAYGNFREILSELAEGTYANDIYLDFSVIDDVNYYNGIVFKGFLKNVSSAVISGGQYDNLMKKMKRRSKAIGFAVYTDLLERMDEDDEPKSVNDEYINIALPKGRLGEKVYDIFAKAGYECPSLLEPNRKLIFENTQNKVRYFWVKPSDVAIYVERGAADIGVVGKDILLEYEPDLYELLDLKLGKCKMAVAGPKDFKDNLSNTLIVATKFSNIAQSYYRSQGRDIDIIHLNGSIEIAPILGLSDVIVDIVETGTTLRENNLDVIEDIVPISARLIANKSAFKFKSQKINEISDNLSKFVEESK